MKTYTHKEIFRFFFDETDEYEKNIKDRIVGYMHSYNNFRNAYIRFEKRINALLGITIMDRFIACDIASDPSLRKLDNIKRNLTKTNMEIIQKIKSKKDELEDILIELYAAYRKLSIHLLLNAAGDVHDMIELKGGIKHVNEKDLFSYPVFKLTVPKVITLIPVSLKKDKKTNKEKFVLAKRNKYTKNLTEAERLRAITINFVSNNDGKSRKNDDKRETVLMFVKGIQNVGNVSAIDSETLDEKSFYVYASKISTVNKIVFEYNTKLDILEVTGYNLKKRSVTTPIITRFVDDEKKGLRSKKKKKTKMKFINRMKAFTFHPFAIDITDRFITITDFSKDYLNYISKPSVYIEGHHIFNSKVDNNPKTISFDKIYETAKNIYNTYKTIFDKSKHIDPKVFAEKKTEMYYALNLFVETEINNHFLRIYSLLKGNESRMVIVNREYLSDMNKNPNSVVYNLILHYIDKALLMLKSKLIENNTEMDSDEDAIEKNFFYKEFSPASSIHNFIDNISPDGNDVYMEYMKYCEFESKSKHSEYIMSNDFAKNDKYIYLDRKTHTNIFSGFVRTINMLKFVLKITNDEKFILDKSDNIYICSQNNRSKIKDMKDLKKNYSLREENIKYADTVKKVINDKRLNHKICQFNKLRPFPVSAKVKTKDDYKKFSEFVNEYKYHMEYLYKTNYFYDRGIYESNILASFPDSDSVFEYHVPINKNSEIMVDNMRNIFAPVENRFYMFFNIRFEERHCSNIHKHSKRLSTTYMHLKYGKNENSKYDTLFALGYNSGKEEPPHNYFRRPIKSLVDSEKSINEDEYMRNSRILRMDTNIEIPL